jgi:hypothetical protein
MGILSSLGTLIGSLYGPAGSGVGSFLGNLLEGKGTEQAFQSGIGALVTGGTMGQTGLLMNALQGGGGNQAVGNQAMNLFKGIGSTGAGVPGASGNPGTGTPYTGTGGIMQNMFTMPEDPLMNSLMREYLYQQRRPPDYNKLLTPLQQRQLATGERAPDYKGTPVPDYRYMNSGRPTGIRAAAAGGMIDGPGSGKSDSIPAQIYQRGSPVQEARLSDGEFVMTADAVKGAGNGNRAAGAAKMYQMMNSLEGRA